MPVHCTKVHACSPCCYLVSSKLAYQGLYFRLHHQIPSQEAYAWCATCILNLFGNNRAAERSSNLDYICFFLFAALSCYLFRHRWCWKQRSRHYLRTLRGCLGWRCHLHWCNLMWTQMVLQWVNVLELSLPNGSKNQLHGSYSLVLPA